MKLRQLLEQLNQLAKERPEALEMEVLAELKPKDPYEDRAFVEGVIIEKHMFCDDFLLLKTGFTGI